MGHRLLQMHWNRIVDPGSHAGGVESRKHAVALVHADDEQMPDVVVALRRGRQTYSVAPAQELEILASGLVPLLVPPGQ